MKYNTKPHIINGIDHLNQLSEWKTMTCLTGMRPTGKLHLGHYVGALKNWIEMEKIPNIRNYFLIADYQALGDYLDDPEKIRQSVKDIVIDWLSVGLDPNKSCFIVQSYIPEFAELTFYLNMFATYSEVIRNPTLKDEIAKIEKEKRIMASVWDLLTIPWVRLQISFCHDERLFLWEKIRFLISSSRERLSIESIKRQEPIFLSRRLLSRKFHGSSESMGKIKWAKASEMPLWFLILLPR